MNEIPRRVTLQPDGKYIWSVPMYMNQEREGYKMGARIWAGIALAVLLFGIFFSLRSSVWTPFLYAAAFSFVILLITFGVLQGLQNWEGEYRRTYRLLEKHISTGFGKRTALFEFHKAKVMIVGKNYIELKAKIGAFRAYIPKEDLSFVQEYIQSRIPAECEIRYE